MGLLRSDKTGRTERELDSELNQLMTYYLDSYPIDDETEGAEMSRGRI